MASSIVVDRGWWYIAFFIAWRKFCIYKQHHRAWMATKMDTGLLHFILPYLFSFVVFLIRILHKWRSTPQKNLPPSPPKLPIVGNLHQIGELLHRSLWELSRHYGHLMLLHFGCVPVLVVSSSDAAREIMKKQDSIFSNRPKLSIPDRLMYGSRDVAFTPYGQHWRQVKSFCLLHLLSTKRVQSFGPVREEETSNMVDEIGQMASSSTIVNLSDMLFALTADVFYRVALGRKYDNDGERRRFKNLIDKFQYLVATMRISEYIPYLSWISRFDGIDRKVEKLASSLDKFLEDVLKEHQRKVEQDEQGGLDFVDILLKSQRENKETSPIEDDTIKAIILDMFLAGIDTTGSALEWTMAELLRNPRTMKKLQNEVRKASEGREEITEDDLEEMPYLKAVIKESLRLHPPGPLLIPRESTEDTQVMGYDIASGTRVLINAWAIGRDPKMWDNPEEFHPERFFEVSTDYRGLHFELIPFGAGRRGCPGVGFAIAIIELALAKLVKRFDFSLPDEREGMDLDMSETRGMGVNKKLPLLVVVTPHVHHF